MKYDLLPVIMKNGSLGVLEFESIPFQPQRVYWLHKLSPDSVRGSHAHKRLTQFFWAISGSVEIELRDGISSKVVELTSNSAGLLLKPGLWRNLYNFSSDAVIMVVADQRFDETDYIRSWENYIEWINNGR